MTKTKEKLLAVLTGSVLILLTVCYIWKLNFYQTHFLPNTYINEMNCSGLDVAEVTNQLEAYAKNYTLKILGRNEIGEQVEVGTIFGEKIKLEVSNAVERVNTLLNTQKASDWLIVSLTKREQSYEMEYAVEFDENALENCVVTFAAFQEENMIAPQDAYISAYEKKEKGCKIIPEVLGTQLDTEAAVSSMYTVIKNGETIVDLSEQNCYVAPAVTAEDETLVSEWETRNKWLSAEITYDWNTNEVVVDGSLIESWIVTDETGSLELDQEAIAAFVAEKASLYDTYGKKRNFTTTHGIEVTLPTGGFGWKTNRAEVTEQLIQFIKEGTVTEIEPIYSNKAPKHGTDDIGNSYVEIDLSNQHLYLYEKGVMIFETDFVSGTMNSTPDCVTPAGVFDITYKQRNATLKGRTYATKVSYWMPFYGNYGMHDATWRSEFGGDIFLTSGSHGCINLPFESAAFIFGYMQEGFPVICYYL